MMSWRRILLGGILAGIVWGLLYALLHELVESHDPSGRPVLPLTPFHGDTAVVRTIVLVNPIVLGILATSLYAAIRQRYGPGRRAALAAAFGVWLFSSWIHVTWAAFTRVSAGKLLGPLATCLPITLVAVGAGAWILETRKKE
jgi:hypothetical protein